MSSEAAPEVLKIANLWVRFLAVCIGGILLLILTPLAGAGLRHEAAGRYVVVIVAAYVVVVAFALALILLFYRFWRMGVRFDDHGVSIRGFLRTDRFGWPEVSHFADGCARLNDGKDVALVWAVAVVLHGGRAITVQATAAWPARRGPKVRAAIAQVTARYQIPAELTGVMPPPASLKRQHSESALGRELGDAILAGARKFSTAAAAASAEDLVDVRPGRCGDSFPGEGSPSRADCSGPPGADGSYRLLPGRAQLTAYGSCSHPSQVRAGLLVEVAPRVRTFLGEVLPVLGFVFPDCSP